MRFAYDSDANALAVTLGDGAVAQTVEFDSGTLVDLDENGEILTIEVISPARQWPLEEIASAYAIVGDQEKRVLFDSGKIDATGAESLLSVPFIVGVGNTSQKITLTGQDRAYLSPQFATGPRQAGTRRQR